MFADSSSQRTPRQSLISLAIVGTALFLAACGGGADTGSTADSTAVAIPATIEPTKVGEITGLSTPESAIYDAKRETWYISNINGAPSALDNNGFISAASADLAEVDTQFIAAGKNGVTLNGPKGMAIVDDTLWVADINTVRGFNVMTGREVASIPVDGAVFLNDITVGTDGTLYVSDTGIRFGADGMSHPGPDRIFEMKGRTVKEAIRFEGSPGPNGLFFGTDGRLIVAPFASTTLMAWTPGESSADSIASGPGGYDGVVGLSDGRVLVTSWNDSTVHAYRNGVLTPLVRNLPSPADLGVDTKLGNIAIPLFEAGRVEVWNVMPSTVKVIAQ